MIDDAMVFSSIKDYIRPPTGVVNGYVDFWIVRKGPCKLFSLFGYNNGVKQFIQIFDLAWHPGPSVVGSTAASSQLTVLTTGLVTGDKCATDVPGYTAGYSYYLRVIDSNHVTLHQTQATAMTGASPVAVTDGQTGHLWIAPVHCAAIAASDNYSIVIPVTGLTLGRGLTIAVSTGSPFFAGGGTDVTMCGTFRPLP
jgi:hypothetical protein